MSERRIAIGETSSFRYIGVEPPLDTDKAETLIRQLHLPDWIIRVGVTQQKPDNDPPYTEFYYDAGIMLDSTTVERVNQGTREITEQIADILESEGDTVSVLHDIVTTDFQTPLFGERWQRAIEVNALFRQRGEDALEEFKFASNELTADFATMSPEEQRSTQQAFILGFVCGFLQDMEPSMDGWPKEIAQRRYQANQELRANISGLVARTPGMTMIEVLRYAMHQLTVRYADLAKEYDMLQPEYEMVSNAKRWVHTLPHLVDEGFARYALQFVGLAR